jgi:protein phosphatase
MKAFRHAQNNRWREVVGVERIALISDIHGNMPALEATLDDIACRGITRIFCLGDLVGKGPHSERAVDICRARCERIIRGNWDDGLATQATDDPTLRWHQTRLGSQRLAFLGALPNSIDFVMSSQRVRLLHASQHGVYHRVYRDDPDDKLQAMFENTDFTGHEFEPDVVGYGDIHQAYRRTFQHKELLNVGSVGNPLDVTLACYAILEGSSDNASATPLAITLVRVPYDIERAIREAEEEHMPDLMPYAMELRTARYRGSQQ